MVVKHVYEAALDSELFGGPNPDSRAIYTLRQRADHCARALCKLGLSEEGALFEINKALVGPALLGESPIERL